jgi:hypothetical protein
MGTPEDVSGYRRILSDVGEASVSVYCGNFSLSISPASHLNIICFAQMYQIDFFSFLPLPHNHTFVKMFVLREMVSTGSAKNKAGNASGVKNILHTTKNNIKNKSL